MNEERKASLMTGSRHGGSISGSSAVLLGQAITAPTTFAQTPSTEYATPLQETASMGRGHHHTNSGSTSYGPATPRHLSGQSYFENLYSQSAMQSADGSSPRLTQPSGLGNALANLDSNGRPSETGPYYRQPRKNKPRNHSASGSMGTGEDWDIAGPSSFRYNGSIDYTTREAREGYSSIQLSDMGDENARFGYSNPALMTVPAPQHTDSMGSGKMQDYTQRESDFYYGVRGPALSAQPSRRLRTGPADPTSTVASATGWLNKFSRWTKGKNKEKGFQVVRSTRALPPMRSALEGDDGDEGVGAGTAAGKARQSASQEQARDGGVQSRGADDTSSSEEGETDSDFSDDEGVGTPRPTSQLSPLPPLLPEIQTGDAFAVQSRMNSRKSTNSVKPQVPRKSSKRRSRHLIPAPLYHSLPQTPERAHSQLYDPPLHENRSTSSTHRLPFTRASMGPSALGGEASEGGNLGDSNSNYSTSSSMLVSPAMVAADDDANSSRPASLGTVNRYKVSMTNTNERLFGTESRAEVVDEHDRKSTF